MQTQYVKPQNIINFKAGKENPQTKPHATQSQFPVLKLCEGGINLQRTHYEKR